MTWKTLAEIGVCALLVVMFKNLSWTVWGQALLGGTVGFVISRFPS